MFDPDDMADLALASVKALMRIAEALEKIERHLDTLDKDSDYPLRVRKVGS